MASKRRVWVNPEAVERLREQRELSQTQLAAEAGVGQSTVSRMEMVAGPFMRANVAKVAQALGVPQFVSSFAALVPASALLLFF